MYDEEHVALFQAIRAGKPLSCRRYMINSTMLGLLGRMTGYTGKKITWEEAINSKESLAPPNSTGTPNRRSCREPTAPMLPSIRASRPSLENERPLTPDCRRENEGVRSAGPHFPCGGRRPQLPRSIPSVNELLRIPSSKASWTGSATTR